MQLHSNNSVINRTKRWIRENRNLFTTRYASVYYRAICNYYSNYYTIRNDLSSVNKELVYTEILINSMTKYDFTILLVLEKLISRLLSIISIDNSDSIYTFRTYTYMPDGNIGVLISIIHSGDTDIDKLMDKSYNKWRGLSMIKRGKLPPINYYSVEHYRGDANQFDISHMDAILTKYYSDERLLKDIVNTSITSLINLRSSYFNRITD